jgi:N-acetylglucosaminyldiphosphoundecaprenol N-acetyl-beta-D-mannosaminyltransferase
VRPFGQVNVLGVGVHVVDMTSAALLCERQIRSGRKGYVCLIGVHGIMEAQRDLDLKAAFAEALLVAPDGMPTVWMGRLQGFTTMQRVFGPDLMVDIIGSAELRNCVHFFCGGGPGVADRLREEMLRRFPGVRIGGTYSPPFRPLTPLEERELEAKVRSVQPDIIWVGLSTPKQERFMARYLPMLDTKLMIGVGAAFLFHTGAIKDSPRWVKQAGMQWLHRLLQEPSRLWKRYLINNPRFIFYSSLQLFGIKHYPLKTTSKPSQPHSYDLNQVDSNLSSETISPLSPTSFRGNQ